MVTFMGMQFEDNIEMIKEAHKDFLRDFLIEELSKDFSSKGNKADKIIQKKVSEKMMAKAA